jgi:hypothetical protein
MSGVNNGFDDTNTRLYKENELNAEPASVVAMCYVAFDKHAWSPI